MTRDEAEEAGRLSAALGELEVGHNEVAGMPPDTPGVCEPHIHLPAWVWLEMIEAGAQCITSRLEVLGVSVGEVKDGSDERARSEMIPRVLKLPQGLWDRIEDYWHRERLASRTAAIRALIERGLG